MVHLEGIFCMLPLPWEDYKVCLALFAKYESLKEEKGRKGIPKRCFK